MQERAAAAAAAASTDEVDAAMPIDGAGAEGDDIVCTFVKESLLHNYPVGASPETPPFFSPFSPPLSPPLFFASANLLRLNLI